MKGEFVLAIETAIAGGSLSLFRRGEEIDYIKGDHKLFKAEDLLINIAGLFDRNQVPLKEINTIFVNRGPGSFTGLRIGISTARGLEKSLGCKCFGVCLFNALLPEPKFKGITAVTLPHGKDQVWRQIFNFEKYNNKLAEDKPVKITLEQFLNELKNNQISNVIFYKDFGHLGGEIIKEALPEINLINVDEPLSRFIGLKGINENITNDVLPVIY